MLYVIAYDISVDRRRTKVAKLLEGFGQRVQYSVFECDLAPAQVIELRRKLKRRLRPEDGDSVRIYSLCGSCRGRVEVIGAGPPVATQPDVLII